ncbi:hypothetical protein L208DRAFT_656508 [Tricholoma matsutake]|nr:hypothetical protein L208DRAFT_656508 [Tricholoma matsutake 945]
MLNDMRFGRVNAKTTEAFKALSRKVTYTDGIEPTELFSTRREVDNANFTRSNHLNTEAHTYVAMEYPGIDSKGERVSKEHMERLLERLVVPNTIQLKV